MNLLWTDESWEEYLYWQATDRKILKRINGLISDIRRSPFEGVGKPEPLRYELSGCWSRRITDEHRLVYEVREGVIAVVSCRYHYG
ncbi:Txe/YoeB family addiction module toxin [Chrysiogenes arsenatis]|uniref:Txe/YoeB family addiction module toxin n=1 Tax=Chrysiogenes arsenatis TaxID=309797 RepID=UPI00041B5E9A|nr:Txe/YoeB family addiction module toxin [Chrysiogenes arsenatis]